MSASPASTSVGTGGRSPPTSGESGAAAQPTQPGMIPPSSAKPGANGANALGGIAASRRCASGRRWSAGAVRSHGSPRSSHCTTRFVPGLKRSRSSSPSISAASTIRFSGSVSPPRCAATEAPSAERTAGLRSSVVAAWAASIRFSPVSRRTTAAASRYGSRGHGHSARSAAGMAANESRSNASSRYARVTGESSASADTRSG